MRNPYSTTLLLITLPDSEVPSRQVFITIRVLLIIFLLSQEAEEFPDNDIALVYLQRDIDFGTTVREIELQGVEKIDENEDGATFIFTGWGVSQVK